MSEQHIDAGSRTRTAVGWWSCGQLVILASYLADAADWIPSPVLVAAVAIGTSISFIAAVAATLAASQAWPVVPSKAMFRCVLLWIASGSSAIAWLCVWLVQ